MRCRNANKEDVSITYKWACDPLVRANSYNQGEISFENHKDWFLQRIDSDSYIFLMFESDKSLPIGLIRFEILENFSVIGVTVAAEQRGKGLASEMLSLAMKEYSARKSIPVHAYIKEGNTASVKAFEKAGFKFVHSLTYMGVNSKMYIWK